MSFLDVDDIDDETKRRRAQLAVDAASEGRMSGFRHKDVVVETTSVTPTTKEDTWRLKKSPSEIVDRQESSTEFLNRCLHEAVTKGRIKPDLDDIDDYDYNDVDDDDNVSFKSNVDGDKGTIGRGRTVEEVVDDHRRQKLRSFGSQNSLRRLMMDRQESCKSIGSTVTTPASPRSSFRLRKKRSTDFDGELTDEIKAAAVDRAMRLAMTETPVVRDAQDFAIYNAGEEEDKNEEEEEQQKEEEIVMVDEDNSTSQYDTLEIVQSWTTVEEEETVAEEIVVEEDSLSQGETIEIVQSWTTIEDETDLEEEELVEDEDPSIEGESLNVAKPWTTIEEETETTVEETEEEEETEKEEEEIQEVVAPQTSKRIPVDVPKPPSLLPRVQPTMTTTPDSTVSDEDPCDATQEQNVPVVPAENKNDRGQQTHPWFKRRSRWLKPRGNNKYRNTVGSRQHEDQEQPRMDQPGRPKKKLGGSFPSWAADFSSRPSSLLRKSASVSNVSSEK